MLKLIDEDYRDICNIKPETEELLKYDYAPTAQKWLWRLVGILGFLVSITWRFQRTRRLARALALVRRWARLEISAQQKILDDGDPRQKRKSFDNKNKLPFPEDMEAFLAEKAVASITPEKQWLANLLLRGNVEISTPPHLTYEALGIEPPKPQTDMTRSKRRWIP